MNTIEIITRFRSRSLNARQYIAYCKSLLSPIKKLFPQLHLYILDDKDELLFFEEDLSNFDETHLYDIIMWDKRIAYHNPDKNNPHLTIDSTCWAPFSSLFFLNRQQNINKNSVADISISVSQGVEIFSAPAIILIDFSNDFIKELSEETLEKLIFCLEQTHDLQYAVVISDDLEDKVSAKGKNLWIGYLTYFSNDYFHELPTIPQGIKVTQTVLGKLFSLGNTFDLSEETVKKAIALRDLLAVNH
jgi:hypothetical protein